jgi:hypothetical protein
VRVASEIQPLVGKFGDGLMDTSTELVDGNR